MVKFKKAYNLNIVSTFVAITFFITSVAYAVDLPSKIHLRLQHQMSTEEGEKRFEEVTREFVRTERNKVISVSGDLMVEYMVGRVIREGFLQPGITVIVGDEILDGVMDIYEKYDYRLNVFAIFTQGLYLNRQYGESTTNEKEKKMFAETFQYLETNVKIVSDRVIIVRNNRSAYVTLHEIIHDVLELSPITERDNLEKFMYSMSERNGRFKYVYSSISNCTFGVTDRHKMLEEFICKFFSGEALFEYEENYLYMKENMPKHGKKLFYESGFIWPDRAEDISERALSIENLLENMRYSRSNI